MYHTRLRHEVNRVNFPPLLRSLETFLSLEGVIESESETDTNIRVSSVHLGVTVTLADSKLGG